MCPACSEDQESESAERCCQKNIIPYHIGISCASASGCPQYCRLLLLCRICGCACNRCLLPVRTKYCRCGTCRCCCICNRRCGGRCRCRRCGRARVGRNGRCPVVINKIAQCCCICICSLIFCICCSFMPSTSV